MELGGVTSRIFCCIEKRLNLVSVDRNDFPGAVNRAYVRSAFRHGSDMISNKTTGLIFVCYLNPLVVSSVFILSWVKPASPKPWFYCKFGGKNSTRVIPITQFFARSDRISLHFVRRSSGLVGPPSAIPHIRAIHSRSFSSVDATVSECNHYWFVLQLI